MSDEQKHSFDIQCLRPECLQIQCQPAPWYGQGIEECCASGSCEVCRGEV